MSSEIDSQTLDIRGSPQSHIMIVSRVAGAVCILGLGVFCSLKMDAWRYVWRNALAGDIMAGLLLVVLFIHALLLLFYNHVHTYFDFPGRQIITVKQLLWLKPSIRTQPLTLFSSIVVRHICHPGGEVADTYTGSVGLKPIDGGPVFWVKGFPTNEDEIPEESYDFARRLEERTGLPFITSGDEYEMLQLATPHVGLN